MILTDDQYDIVLSEISERHPGLMACGSCGRGAIKTVGYVVYELPEFHPPGGVLDMHISGVRSMPIITLTCEDCGSVEFFNAIALGLIDKTTGQFKKPETERGDRWTG